jgi:hypothetical protein
VLELPIVAPAPVVTAPMAVFHDVLDRQCPWRHFPPNLTRLIVLPNTRLANSARGLLESAAKTNRARWLSAVPWRADAVQRRRESLLALDETLCAPVGRLVADVDRHDNHGDGRTGSAGSPRIAGWPRQRPGPPRAVEDRVPLLPGTA